MKENVIDYLRIALYGALIFIGFTLYQAWNLEHKPEAPAQTTAVTTAPSYAPEVLPVATSTVATVKTATTAAPSAAGQIIRVKTDLLDIAISTHGGDIVESHLLKYMQRSGDTQPYLLLNDKPDSKYIAQSGLLSKSGPDTTQGQALYTPENTDYTLMDDQKELEVKLHWQNNQGLTVTKTFTFHRGSYEIGVAYEINNQSNELWQGNLYSQLLRTAKEPENGQGLSNIATFFGAAVSTPDKHFQKIPFKDMLEKNLNQTAVDGWAAMLQHYFVSAWIPPSTVTSNYYTKVTPDGLYVVGMVGPTLQVAPKTSVQTLVKLYSGPELGDQMKKAAPNLDLTIDYGMLWFLSVAIFWMMEKIYKVIGNWGWAIVLVTVIIKILFYQLSAKSYRSMSMLKKLQPRIELLKERYGSDKQKFTQATLELYKQEKVNPMSGCLPILVQIPVFIALYWVLVESVQLREAPFILWIHDLSQKDPYYILPILMGITMFLQQRLNPPPPDPMQAKMMMLMPIIFTALFFNFPAGLLLYWCVNNILSFLQQWFIMHRLEKETTLKKVK